MIEEKVLFFYLKSGNGHYAVVKSISDFLLKKYGKQSVLINAAVGSNKFINFLFQDFYNKSQLKFKFLFEALYFINKSKIISKFSNFAIYFFLRNKIKEYIEVEKPNKIISAHFFLNRSIKRVLKELNLDISFVIIVTDPFTAPLLWFTENTQNFIVSSERVKKTALKMGVDEKLINIFPVVIDEKYSNNLNAEEIRLKKIDLNLDLDKKTILMLSGGGGFPNGINIFKNIIKYNGNHQIIVVCGSNEIMFKKLTDITSKLNLKNVKIFGFVNFVHDLINISDVVVTKGGPASIMEILILKKIPIIASYIWEQEKGNVEFVVDNNLGVYEKNSKKLGLIINDVLKNKDNICQKYLENIEKMNISNGLYNVSEYINNL